jgi:hypothetical protein
LWLHSGWTPLIEGWRFSWLQGWGVPLCCFWLLDAVVSAESSGWLQGEQWIKWWVLY